LNLYAKKKMSWRRQNNDGLYPQRWRRKLGSRVAVDGNETLSEGLVSYSLSDCAHIPEPLRSGALLPPAGGEAAARGGRSLPRPRSSGKVREGEGRSEKVRDGQGVPLRRRFPPGNTCRDQPRPWKSKVKVVSSGWKPSKHKKQKLYNKWKCLSLSLSLSLSLWKWDSLRETFHFQVFQLKVISILHWPAGGALWELKSFSQSQVSWTNERKYNLNNGKIGELHRLSQQLY